MAKSSSRLTIDDIQTILLSGFGSLYFARFILLKITDADKTKKGIVELLKSGMVKTGKDSKGPIALNIAVTKTGLETLGLSQDVLSTFSREFLEGMVADERSTLLGDFGPNDPKNWNWGAGDNQIDLLFMFYADSAATLNTTVDQVQTETLSGAVDIISSLDTYPFNYKRKEHFGFADGISQPLIKGFHSKEKCSNPHDFINPGEFILGYKNEYDNYSPSPYVKNNMGLQDLDDSPIEKNCKDLGKNGSYMVFRQMKQDVKKFWEYQCSNSRENAAGRSEKAIKLASKMVGRWPDGQPLVLDPNGAAPISGAALNNFGFIQEDEYGVKCPFGAHIRRTNPRDHTHPNRGINDSLELTKKHRMIRRGRIYGKPLDQDFNIEDMIAKIKKAVNHGQKEKEEVEADRGLHFICMVSDISRQFEFVQNVWCNTPTFAALNNEVDPLISTRVLKNGLKCDNFTTPQQLVRNRYKNLPVFTEVKGGAYFFLPGKKALEFIINH